LRSTTIGTAAVVSLLVGVFVHGEQGSTVTDLLERFRRTTVFWQQLEVAKEIVKASDASVLIELEPCLTLDDRHLRGNAAFVFAGFGDDRGFETIFLMLTDRSDRGPGQGTAVAFSPTTPPSIRLSRQIEADRYYAVHLLGQLKDPRAVYVLIPLLADQEINYNVAWALGQIADRKAVRPLIEALDDPVALMRVSAIGALVELRAMEALPHLRRMLNDDAKPSAGRYRSVAEAAKDAIAKLTAQGQVVARSQRQVDE